MKQKRREMREEYKRRKQEEEEAKKFKNRVKKAAQDMASTLRSKPVADESRGISGVMSRLSLSLRSDQTGKSQTSRGISPMRAMSIFRKTETAETKQTSKVTLFSSPPQFLFFSFFLKNIICIRILLCSNSPFIICFQS